MADESTPYDGDATCRHGLPGRCCSQCLLGRVRDLEVDGAALHGSLSDLVSQVKALETDGLGAALLAENAALRRVVEAARPFAEYASDPAMADLGDDFPLGLWVATPLTLGQSRRLADALAELGGESSS